MLKLVVEIKDSAEEAIIRELVAVRAGVTVIGPNEPRLEDRADVDTLVMEALSVADRYHGSTVQWPNVLGWVVVNEARQIRLLLKETTITAIDPEQAHIKTKASWIAALGLGAYFEGDLPRFGPDTDPMSLWEDDAERGESYIITNGLYWYPEFLNAFEVMERHNASGATPPIRRVGVAARNQWGELWILGLLRAYETYRERKLAGAYDPPNYGDS